MRPLELSTAARRRLALQAFAFVAALTLVNALFNLGSHAAGLGYPYDNFLSDPIDNFGDFFSLLRSYPDGARAIVHDAIGLHALLPLDPPSAHPAQLAAGLPQVTHFHMIPLATIASLAALYLLRWIDPVLLFLLLGGALTAYAAMIFRRWSRDRAEGAAWFALWLIGYPTLIGFTRGNLFAEATTLCLIDALLRGLRRETPLRCAILFAIAVNLRPNAILFGLPLLVFYWPVRVRFVATVAVSGIAIAAASFAAAHLAYPAYTLPHFLAGLKAYYRIYAIGFFGLAHGSSLFGALKLLSGGVYAPWQDRGATLVALTIAAAAMALRAARRIDEPTLLLLICAAYCLGSTVIGDYHLGVFMIVPLALAVRAAPAEPREAARTRIILAAALLMLAPKNYLFLDQTSLQVIWNPLILLAVAAVLIVGALPRRPFRRNLSIASA